MFDALSDFCMEVFHCAVVGKLWQGWGMGVIGFLATKFVYLCFLRVIVLICSSMLFAQSVSVHEISWRFGGALKATKFFVDPNGFA